MTILIIICGVFCLLAYLLDNWQGGRANFSNLLDYTLEEEKEVPQEDLAPAQQNRRVQQILKRQKKNLQDWEIELNYRDRETSIGEKLLQLHRTEVNIGSQRVELQQMLLQITQQNNMMELREKGLQIEGQKIELRDLLTDLTQRENMVVLKQQEIFIDGKKVEARQLLNQIEHRENILDIEQRDIVLNGKRVELKELVADITYQSKMVNVGRAEVALGKQEILVEGKRVELQRIVNSIEHRENLMVLEQKDIMINGKRVELNELLSEIIFQGKMVKVDKALVELGKQEILIDGKRVEMRQVLNQIEHRENLLELEQKDIQLNGKRVELKELLAEVIYQGKMVKVGKAELALGWKELKHAYNLKVFELQKTLHHIKTQMEQLRLAKVSFKLQQQEEVMKLYAQKLSLTEQHIRQMYAIRMAWLKIQNKENHLDYREQREKVQTLFNDTQSKIRELHLTRWENDLIWDKKEMERRWGIINYIEDMWYHNSGMPVEKNMLEHYRKSGFTPDSPLIAENQQLRGLIHQLENQLPPG